MPKPSRSLPLLGLLSLALLSGCEGEPRNRPRGANRPNVQPREVIGKTTQEVADAPTEVQQGGQVASTKLDYNPTLPGNTYVKMVGKATTDQVRHAVDLYQAANGRYPKDTAEFKAEIIQANNLALPQLPATMEWGYDPQAHKLVVIEYPEKKAELGRQFREKVGAP
jgi:hypothetical protein